LVRLKSTTIAKSGRRGGEEDHSMNFANYLLMLNEKRQSDEDGRKKKRIVQSNLTKK